MGGAACARFGVERVNRATHDRTLDFVLERLDEGVPGLWRAPVQSLRAKQDFGDIDIIIDSARVEADLGQTIEEWQARLESILAARGADLNAATHSFGKNMPRHLTQGRGVLSLAVPCPGESKLMQVDLILTKTEDLLSTAQYYAWGGLSNLLSRQINHLNPALRLGDRGLLWDPDRSRDTARILTRDLPEALDFVGYDGARWAKGFEDWAGTFEFTTQIPTFEPTAYLLENRTKAARLRDMRNPCYMAFLGWLNERGYLQEGREPVMADAEAWEERVRERFAAAFLPGAPKSLATP